MEDPSETQQKKIISRISASVERLNETLAAVNKEMETAASHSRDVEYVKSVCEGYLKRIHVAAQVDNNN